MQAKNGINNLQGGSSFDIKKYIRMIKRRKLFIVLTFFIVFVATLLAALKFGPARIYSTNALLQFEDRRALSGMNARGRPENDSKLGVLTTRSFLNKVVSELSYSLFIKNVNRVAITDSIHLDENYTIGKYHVEKAGDQLKLFYTSKDKTIKDKLVKTIPVNSKVIAYGGFQIFQKHSFWDTHTKLDFSLLKRGQAVEILRASLAANWKSREKTLLGITISGSDPIFIAKTLNTVLNEFVEQNLIFKKFHTTEVLRILTTQLERAKADLDAANEELKRFRERNPLVGIAGETAGTITGISNIETEKMNLSSKKAQLEDLFARYKNASGDEKNSVLNEVLAYLSSLGGPTIPALSAQYTTLMAEREKLEASYAPGHPVLVENQKKINALQQKIELTSQKQLGNISQKMTVLSRKVRRETSKIRGLPAKELRLAELQRKRNVADGVYSTLLVRYNQAKVADAVEVGDIIILDPAIVPQTGGKLAVYIKYGVIALVLGLVFSFGTVLLQTLLDKTVRTADELEKIVPIRVVAKIPVVGSEKDTPVEFSESGIRTDPKLVTADYSPTPVGEAYRSLRTQLLFNNNQKNNRSIFVTSLNPGEGKSLNAGNIAITFAQQKIPTLLIDADLRRGVLHNSFACNKKPGLSDFLYSSSEINDENIRKVIQQTHIPNLFLLSSGMSIPNPSEILGSQRGRDVIKFLSERFGFVIIDTPPIMVTADSVVISQYVDHGLFVIRAGKTNVQQAKEKIAEYKDFHPHIFGLILNCADLNISKENYKYSYYNY